jgi:hypothetical protein
MQIGMVPAAVLRCLRHSLPLIGATGFIAGLADPAVAYRFFPKDRDVAAAEAVRWWAEDFPLRFQLQDNVPEFVDETRWREIVSGALRQWSGIATAEVSLGLEPGLAPPAGGGDGTDATDGEFTIGWLTDEGFAGGGALAYAVLQWSSDRRLDSCDIVFVTATFQRMIEDGVPLEAVEREISATALHEVGHCLGLDHTEPHPGWPSPDPLFPESVDVVLPAAPGFRPDTVMSYALSRPDRLSEDEVVGASLLYPAPGFLESRGAVAGDVVRGSVPSRFAYVQAVYPGAEPRMGPGTFASKHGHYQLYGLRPGPVLLWIHPLLIHGPLAHGLIFSDIFFASRDPDSLDILDQWQWVHIEAGTVVGMPPFETVTGRSP